MKRWYAGSVRGTLRAAVLGMTVAVAAPGHAQTQPTRQISVVQDMASVGLAFGQSLRYSWANVDDSEPDRRVFEPDRIAVTLLDADARVIAQRAAAVAAAGRFHVFEIKRGDIPAPGDPPSGRLQLRLKVTVVGRLRHSEAALAQRPSPGFVDAVEIVDDASGATAVVFGGGRNEISLDDSSGPENPNDETPVVAAVDDHLIGLVPRQAVRVSAVNPLAPAIDGRRYRMLVAARVLDADGRTIAQGTPTTVDPGTTRWFDFRYADLPLSPEITGRAQVRVRVQRFFHGIPSRISQGGPAPGALEVVDEVTGRTVLFISQKPKEIVVVGSK